MKYSLLLHYNSGSMKAPQSYVIRTLHYLSGYNEGMSHVSRVAYVMI